MKKGPLRLYATKCAEISCREGSNSPNWAQASTWYGWACLSLVVAFFIGACAWTAALSNLESAVVDAALVTPVWILLGLVVFCMFRAYAEVKARWLADDFYVGRRKGRSAAILAETQSICAAIKKDSSLSSGWVDRADMITSLAATLAKRSKIYSKVTAVDDAHIVPEAQRLRTAALALAEHSLTFHGEHVSIVCRDVDELIGHYKALPA